MLWSLALRHALVQGFGGEAGLFVISVRHRGSPMLLILAKPMSGQPF